MRSSSKSRQQKKPDPDELFARVMITLKDIEDRRGYSLKRIYHKINLQMSNEGKNLEKKWVLLALERGVRSNKIEKVDTRYRLPYIPKTRGRPRKQPVMQDSTQQNPDSKVSSVLARVIMAMKENKDRRGASIRGILQKINMQLPEREQVDRKCVKLALERGIQSNTIKKADGRYRLLLVTRRTERPRVESKQPVTKESTSQQQDPQQTPDFLDKTRKLLRVLTRVIETIKEIDVGRGATLKLILKKINMQHSDQEEKLEKQWVIMALEAGVQNKIIEMVADRYRLILQLNVASEQPVTQDRSSSEQVATDPGPASVENNATPHSPPTELNKPGCVRDGMFPSTSGARPSGSNSARKSASRSEIPSSNITRECKSGNECHFSRRAKTTTASVSNTSKHVTAPPSRMKNVARKSTSPRPTGTYVAKPYATTSAAPVKPVLKKLKVPDSKIKTRSSPLRVTFNLPSESSPASRTETSAYSPVSSASCTPAELCNKSKMDGNYKGRKSDIYKPD